MWGTKRIQSEFEHVVRLKGKSGGNREEVVRILLELREQCELHEAHQARLTVMSILVSFYFDTAMRKMTGMSGQRWGETFDLLQEMMKLLLKNHKKIRVSSV